MDGDAQRELPQEPVGDATASRELSDRSLRRQAGRQTRRRRWRGAVGSVLLGLLLVAGGLCARTPSVATAPALVAAGLRLHHATGVASPPRRVAAALIAIEDQQYRAPPGVDILAGIVHYVVARAQAPTSHPGGSTLAQQLAKQLYTPGRVSVAAKVEQVVLAFKLEVRYSKARVLAMYLNTVYFGDGAWGVTQASARYFGKAPGALDWGQAAMLAGLPQAPSGYDPLVHPEAARDRQRAVLAQLVATGVLSRRAAASAASAPLHLVTPSTSPLTGAPSRG